MLKRIVSEIKDGILPTSDQFNTIMFDNVYVKHKVSKGAKIRSQYNLI